jgi:cytochrome P450
MDSATNPNPGIHDPSLFEHELGSEFECATARDPSQRRVYIFGAGRRVCQGMHIAERSLFLAVTRLLWGFDFKVPESGNLPDVDDLVGELTVQPAPFEARIVARSEENKILVQETWTDVEDMVLMREGSERM